MDETLSHLPEKSRPRHDVSNLVKTARILVDMVDKYRNDYEGAWKVDQQHEAAKRTDEENHKWKAWGFAMVRWAIGIVLAIVLYSALVFIDDKTDWIKIPIRDIVLEAAGNQSK